MDRAPTTTAGAALRLALALAVGAVSAAIAWWRLGPVTRGTVWAEDGGVFLRERLALGPVDSLLHPYAGYLHLLPRLLVDAGRALPVTEYAHVLAGGSCLVVGGAATTVCLLARDVVPLWPLRALLAAVPALVPLAPWEILGNAANLHWTMLAVAPWLFAYRARTWWGAGLVALTTAPVVLTEPQTAVFAPLLLLAWLPPRDPSGARAWPRAIPVTVVALGGLAAQVVTAMTDERDGDVGARPVADVAAGWLLQPFARIWNPDSGVAIQAVVMHGWAVVVVPAVLLLLVFVAALVVGSWRARWSTVALAGFSVGVWWAGLVVNSGAALAWAHPVAAFAAFPPQRYAAAAGLLLLAAAVVAASALIAWAGAPRRSAPDGVPDSEQEGARKRPRAGRSGAGRSDAVRSGGAARLAGALAGWTLVAAVVVATLGNAAPGATRRSDGPVWAEQIPAAVATCTADPSGVVAVRTVPWDAAVPCSWVLGR